MALEFPSETQHYNFLEGMPVNKHGLFGGQMQGEERKRKKCMRNNKSLNVEAGINVEPGLFFKNH